MKRTSTTDNLKTCIKGDEVTIDGITTVVIGECTVGAMGQKSGGPFVLIPKAPRIRMFWTADNRLVFIGPQYEKGDDVCIVMARADLALMNVPNLMEGAAAFGLTRQAQESVSLTYLETEFWFSDIGTAGADDIPEQNEGNVVQGPTACLRFYHLTPDWEDRGAEHLIYLGPQPKDNQFSDEPGTVWETLWRGKIVDPEDVIKFAE